MRNTAIGAVPALVALFGCGGDAQNEVQMSVPSEEEIGSVEESVINGTTVGDAANPGAVAVYHQDIRPCSGTLIRRQWVLTARHCVTTDHHQNGPLLSSNQITISRAANPGLTPPVNGVSFGQQIIADSGKDYALVRIFPEMAGPVGLWNGKTNETIGKTMRVMGYGRFVRGDFEVEDGASGAGTLRMADLTVFASDADTFSMRQNGAQTAWHGDSGGPAFRLTDVFGRSLTGVAGVLQLLLTESGSEVDYGSVDSVRSWIKREQRSPGDVDNTGTADVMLTGASGWSTIPVAFFSAVTFGFGVTNRPVASFPVWATTPGAKALSGDFNGDGRTDIALLGATTFTSVPIAFSSGNGSFTVTNSPLADFPGWASHPGVKTLTGDFNGDGRTDIALTGGAGWGGIPVAFSNGNGKFTVVTIALSTFPVNFPALAASTGAKALAGDFDGDGRDDIALTGVPGWTSVPVAFSNGDGNFASTNTVLPNFPGLAATAGARAVAGDFNGDGRDDIALTGVAGWGSVPVAFSALGSFTFTNSPVATFPGWAAEAGVKIVSGDLNRDRIDDIILTGGSGWAGIRTAAAHGDGTFTAAEFPVSNFPAWAATAGTKAVSGSQAQ